eukprot:Em0010g896a
MATVTFANFLDSLPADTESLLRTPNLRLVVGNESCDLDSMVCSLAWSHYLTCTGKASAVPVFQCHPDELPLRTESVWLFQELGIPTTKLFYIGSLSVDKIAAAGAKVNLTLVDHNSPTGTMADLLTRVGTVVEIIDHHKDGGKWECPCTIEPVGSCATLVTEKLLGDSGYMLDKTVATLLLAAILLDTVNLSSAEGRVTEKDSAVVQKLLPLVAGQQEEFYHQLLDARLNVSWLTTPQLLQRDFKKVQCGHYVLGFCSIPCLVSELTQREHFNGDCFQFSQLQSVHALILLGALFPKEGPKRRQIGLYQPHDHMVGVSRDFAESISSVLESQEVLNCEHLSVPSFHGVVLEQRNTLMSRKQIVPMVSDFLAAVEHDSHPGLSDVIRTYATEQSHDKDSAPRLSVSSLSLADIQPSVGAPQDPMGAVLLPSTSHHDKPPPIAEYTPEEEATDHRRYRMVCVGGEKVRVDLNLIQQYRGIVQHGGYSGSDAIIFISACYLPPRNIPDYQEILHQLFFYILSVLEQIVVDGYIVVYLHYSTPQNSLPGMSVFHKFYKMVDRRLRKQLQLLYIVHPTVWVKAMLRLMRPIFQFYRKINFIGNLQELSEHVPLNQFIIQKPSKYKDTPKQKAPPTQEAVSGQEVLPTTLESIPELDAPPTLEGATKLDTPITLEAAVPSTHEATPN